MRSGSIFGRISYTINAIYFLSALLLTNSIENQTLPPRVVVGLFTLGLCNVHAAMSSTTSRPSMALISLAAMVGNVAVWWPQLIASVVSIRGHPSPALMAALGHTASFMGLPHFITFLNMCQLSLMPLLLLFLEVKFNHVNEVVVRALFLLQGVVVFLPVLAARAGVDTARLPDNWPVVDALILAIYCTSVSAFFFGSPLDRVMCWASALFYSGVLLAFFKFKVSGLEEELIGKPDGWAFGVRQTIALWLASVFLLRFRYLAEPTAIKPKQKQS